MLKHFFFVIEGLPLFWVCDLIGKSWNNKFNDWISAFSQLENNSWRFAVTKIWARLPKNGECHHWSFFAPFNFAALNASSWIVQKFGELQFAIGRSVGGGATYTHSVQYLSFWCRMWKKLQIWWHRRPTFPIWEILDPLSHVLPWKQMQISSR